MSARHAPASSARQDDHPAAGQPAARDRPYLAHGMLLSIGAVAWAVSQVIVGGLNPDDNRFELLTFGIGSAIFQVGLLAFLRVLDRTRALGSGRVARLVLRVESVLLFLAIASTTVDALGISDLDQVGWAALDAFWPLSMVGMFLIGIRVAVAGNWHGPARFWPLVAESWAVMVSPTMAVAGPAAATMVSVVNLLVGYTVLGQLVARRDGVRPR
jgi:hypothetical protein